MNHTEKIGYRHRQEYPIDIKKNYPVNDKEERQARSRVRSKNTSYRHEKKKKLKVESCCWLSTVGRAHSS